MRTHLLTAFEDAIMTPFPSKQLGDTFQLLLWKRNSPCIVLAEDHTMVSR